VMWIWVGLSVVVFGTLVALVPSLSPVRAAVAVPVAKSGPISGQAAVVGVTGGGD
jgi:hypothetical protein